MPRVDSQMIHLYRGTTPDWPGSETIQYLGITCTSSDPLVATLFGLECLRHGSGVIQVARFEQVNGLCTDVNVLAQLECEVTLAVSPIVFQRQYVTRTLDALHARRILDELGFPLPARIDGYAHLNHILRETQFAGERLDAALIEEFDRRALT